MDKVIVFGFLIVATVLEATGDAVIRMGLASGASWPVRLGLFAAGGLMLFGYGLSLNLAPIEFQKVVGLYIATLFVVWQVVNYFAFKSLPSLPVLVGGVLIVIGGLVVTFWERA